MAVDDLVNALRRKIAAYEGAGMTELAEANRRKLAAVTKADEPSLGDLTKAELLERAEAADIDGRSSMNKAELVEALEQQEG